jgi:tetratricopeptide (TPR) repeat protein
MKVLRTLVPVLLLPFLVAFAQESIPQALTLIESKDYNGARKILETMIDHDAANAEAHARLGVLLSDHFRDYDGAEEHLEQAVELVDNNAEYHFILGNVYGIQAQLANIFSKMSYAGKVKSQFLKAVELKPNELRYRSGLMNYYLMAPGIVGGSVSKAKEQAEAILRIDPGEGHIAYAQIASYEKDYPEAEKHYKEAIAADPSKGIRYNLLGYFYLRLKRVDDAIAQFRSYVRLSPDDPNSYDSLGEGLLEKGDANESLQNYAKALELNPGFVPSVFGTARCFEAKGMKSEALAAYKKYLDLAPQGANASAAKKKVEDLSE